MTRKTTLLALAAAFATASLASVAMAQSAPQRIKNFQDWGAYSYTSAQGKGCYVLSVPSSKEPSDRDHGDVFFMLAQLPGNADRIEPQFIVGYPFKEASDVKLTIDGKIFDMFTQGNKAWLKNPAEEAAVVAAMRAGSQMSISGQSARGTQTNYGYSLRGVTASLNEIRSCN